MCEDGGSPGASRTPGASPGAPPGHSRTCRGTPSPVTVRSFSTVAGYPGWRDEAYPASRPLGRGGAVYGTIGRMAPKAGKRDELVALLSERPSGAAAAGFERA